MTSKHLLRNGSQMMKYSQCPLLEDWPLIFPILKTPRKVEPLRKEEVSKIMEYGNCYLSTNIGLSLTNYLEVLRSKAHSRFHIHFTSLNTIMQTWIVG